MYILGISCWFHDSSVALLKDGIIVCAAQEERFTRKKHDTSFPINALKYCLNKEGICINDIEKIGFYEKPLLKFERILYQHIQFFPWSYKTFLQAMPSWFNEKLRLVKKIKKEFGYKGEILFIPHHHAHAGSFFVSPYKKACVVNIDGVGEFSTTTYGIGIDNKIHLEKEIQFPSSLGLLYSTITAFLGMSVNNSEYKVMGLAPYGNQNRETNRFYKKLMSIIYIKEDGSFQMDMDYFIYHYKDKMPHYRLEELFEHSIRIPIEEITQSHKDIAAAVQMVYEDIFFKILNHVHWVYKCDNLVLGGGCGLNSVANGKILSKTPFKQVWSQPEPGDGGTCIGVASYVYHSILGFKREFVFNNAYLGPSYTNYEIQSFLDKNKICYTEFKTNQELIDTTAKLVFENNVVGWFQKGMEWGPRALGARSILSNACNPKMQEILNTKVKHREKFRPFAPVVCTDDAQKYFVCDNPIPEMTDFMLMVYPVKEEFRTKLPAITHVDGSGRLQTVSKEQNELYYNVIKRFGELSGIPILINTSFNIRGEPIVCTPQDAYKCMMGTGIDCLIMGNFLIKRENNQKDKWDSESLARD